MASSERVRPGVKWSCPSNAASSFAAASGAVLADAGAGLGRPRQRLLPGNDSCQPWQVAIQAGVRKQRGCRMSAISRTILAFGRRCRTDAKVVRLGRAQVPRGSAARAVRQSAIGTSRRPRLMFNQPQPNQSASRTVGAQVDRGDAFPFLPGQCGPLPPHSNPFRWFDRKYEVA